MANTSKNNSVKIKKIDLKSVRSATELYLERLFLEILKDSESVGPQYQRLITELKRVALAGGKRFRPYLFMLSYFAFSDHFLGDNNEVDEVAFDAVFPGAVAIELMHMGLLIHDDFIDRDDFRHGQPNITGSYGRMYSSIDSRTRLVSDEDVRHFSQSTAVLAGDVLLSEAYRQLAKCNVSSDTNISSIDLFGDALFRVVGGELVDMESSFLGSINGSDASTALSIATNKTASYSFILPLIMGAQIAGATADQISLLRKIGKLLGVSFQYRDDLLGVFADTKDTGKSTDSDIREGKPTLLAQETRSRLSFRQLGEFDELYGKSDISSTELNKVRHLIKNCGAKQAVSQKIKDSLDESRQLLNGIDSKRSTHFKKGVIQVIESIGVGVDFS